MIWLRRAITFPLWLILFLLLSVTLVVFQISGTFLNPDYYPEQLRDADIYEFVLVDVLTSALDEARAIEMDEIGDQGGGINVEENPLVSSGLTTEEIVSSINRAIPPEWIQETVEQVFDEFGHYMTGDRDEFSITVAAGDRVVAIVEEFKTLTREADAYNLFFDKAVEPTVAKVAEKELPLGLEVDSKRLEAAVRKVADPEWVQAQVEAVLDEVTPYLVGEKDGFQITLQLAERVEIASNELKSLMLEVDAYEVIYSEVVGPALRDEVGDVIEIPINETITIELTVDEVIGALRQVAPPAWVQEQAERIIDDATGYFVGKTEAFESSIDLRENKRAAKSVLAEIVEGQIVSRLVDLPRCTDADAPNGGIASLIPNCVPPLVGTQEFLDRSALDFEALVEVTVLELVPDNVAFGDKDILAALDKAGANENADRLEFLRSVLSSRWSYTEIDLLNDVTKLNSDWRETGDDDPREIVDDIRGFLSDGYSFTDEDFRELIDRNGEPSTDVSVLGDGSPSELLDKGRGLFGPARALRWLLVLPLVGLLLAMGFLGGQGWAGRSIWVGGALLLASVAILLLAGPVYNTLTGERLATERAETVQEALANLGGPSSDFPNTSALLIGKGFDFGVQVADDFMGGLAASASILGLVGVLIIVTAFFWSELLATVRRIRSP